MHPAPRGPVELLAVVAAIALHFCGGRDAEKKLHQGLLALRRGTFAAASVRYPDRKRQGVEAQSGLVPHHQRQLFAPLRFSHRLGRVAVPRARRGPKTVRFKPSLGAPLVDRRQDRAFRERSERRGCFLCCSPSDVTGRSGSGIEEEEETDRATVGRPQDRGVLEMFRKLRGGELDVSARCRRHGDAFCDAMDHGLSCYRALREHAQAKAQQRSHFGRRW